MTGLHKFARSVATCALALAAMGATAQ
ncbi:MAG: hypothetical protein H6R02_3132, partial [Burkholderiaceae bacterium]|nr:hypothetical protein [Burkholderiaceae bacterium]